MQITTLLAATLATISTVSAYGPCGYATPAQTAWQTCRNNCYNNNPSCTYSNLGPVQANWDRCAAPCLSGCGSQPPDCTGQRDACVSTCRNANCTYAKLGPIPEKHSQCNANCQANCANLPI
ncbi:hypothetical protein HK097_000162 [Rhizophlyctis rosea]|uniref:Uncharacterized protein n=1 Tax=Rhizophlyctis rosea TaxID=64517 RepID=A0AAD5S8C5_9FUNG|nr:hypothetical protein HK097_000162 [Rhizophlyctis rosea]